jgi:Tol biopolymer transport system component
MSPEQVRGQAVDHRSDIFAFGAILHEMLSGRPAFRRDTSADTMSAILKEDPPELSGTRRGLPPVLERVVHHCLEKNPAERFQSARDLAFNLEAAGSASGSGAVEALPAASAIAHSRRHLPLVFVIGLAAGILIGASLVGLWGRRPELSLPTLKYLSYSGSDREPASSPDGRLIAYTSIRGGRSQIWIKQYPGGDEVALTTGPGDGTPRFSPDAAAVLFVRTTGGRGSLFKIPVVGGEPRKILDDAIGGDWSPDGREIVFLRQDRSKNVPAYVMGVAQADGGGQRDVARLEGSVLLFPRWSPDGSTIAATRAGTENVANSIFLTGADGRGARTLLPPPPGGELSAVAWTLSGASLVYSKSETVVTGAVRGGTSRLIKQDLSSGHAETLMWLSTLAPVIDVFGGGRVLLGALSQRQNLQEASLSPGFAVSAGRWLTRGNSSDRQPTYSPDGEWILFSSNRSGNLDLWKLSTTS